MTTNTDTALRTVRAACALRAEGVELTSDQTDLADYAADVLVEHGSMKDALAAVDWIDGGNE